MPPEISILLPARDEAPHLVELLEALERELSPLELDYEVVVVDDGSSDETWSTVRAAHRSDPRVRGLSLSRSFGKESAICAGLEASRGRAVVVMDADFQHPPELVPQLIEGWREGFEVVEAVKADRGDESWLYRLFARLFYSSLGRLSRLDLQNASDFKLLDRKVLEALSGMPEHHVFFRGMSAWTGFRRKRVPFRVGERPAGVGRWSTWALIRLALTGVSSFSSAPIYLITFLGALFLLLSLVLGTISLSQWLAGIAVTGFTTVNLLLLIIGSMLMIALGVIGHYIAMIYDEVKGRPRFLVADSIGPGESVGNEPTA